MGARYPQTLSYPCARGNSGLDAKFQEAIRAVEPLNLEVELSKMAYKDELKKGGKENASQQAVGAGKATPDKSKML